MNLRSALNTLEISGLIQLFQVEPDLEYSFHNSLVQDVVYASLLKSDRRNLHQAVGMALESIYSQKIEEISPLLAEHFLESGDTTRALKYLIQAGDSAARLFANAEARLHYQSAVEIVRKSIASNELTKSVSSANLTHLYTSYGRVLELSGQFESALEIYSEMENVAQEREDPEMELAALIAQTPIYATPTELIDLNRAAAITERALDISQQLGDREAEARIYWQMVMQNFFRYNPKAAKEAGEKSLRIARELDLPELVGFVLNDIANFVTMVIGDVEQGLNEIREAEQIWEKTGNMPMYTNSLNVESQFNYLSGQYEEGVANAQKALKISHEIKNLWGVTYSLGLTGMNYSEFGEVGLALNSLEQSNESRAQSGFEGAGALSFSYIANIYLFLGATKLALSAANQALKVTEEKAQFWRPQALGVLIHASVMIGDLSSAQRYLDQAYEFLDGEIRMIAISNFLIKGHLVLLAAQNLNQELVKEIDKYIPLMRSRQLLNDLCYALYYRGMALYNLGDLDAAQANLSEAAELALKTKSRLIGWTILGLLAHVEERRGNVQAAQVARQNAQEVIHFLADRCPTDELREIFFDHVEKEYPGLLSG
jgi:tetratricopeptide (TPR) repeat protein